MSMNRRALLKFGATGAAGLVVGGVSGCAPKDNDGDSLDVAIIGGGVSGLVAGYELKRAGLTNFAVFEARDRVGGRTFNQYLGKAFCESGGKWVGPGQTAIQDVIRELGLELFPSYFKGKGVVLMGGKAQVVEWGDSPISDTKLFANIDELARTVPVEAPWTASRAAEWDKMTFADYLKTYDLSAADQLAVRLLTKLTWAGYPEDMSFLWILTYVHAAGSIKLLESMEHGAQENRVVGGSQMISLKLAEALGDKVKLSSPIASVSGWDGRLVTIETPKGKIKAKRVIMALGPALADGIRFEPALPAKRQAVIDGWPRGGSGITTHVSFAKPFWRDAGLSGQALSPDGPFMWSVDASPPDGSQGVLMAYSWVGKDTPADRKTKTLQAYVDAFGPEAAKVTGYVEQDWTKETYTRGCVAPVTPGFLTSGAAGLRENNGALVWAGTETSLIWMGYMDGAARAGKRAALVTLNALAQKSTS